MDLQALTDFFMWCTIINLGLLTFWSALFLTVPGLIYKIHHRFWPIPRDTYNVMLYGFLGLFKIFVIIFNLVPYIALLIIK